MHKSAVLARGMLKKYTYSNDKRNYFIQTSNNFIMQFSNDYEH